MTVEERTREVHPLTLFAPEGARLLMLGSFPPPRERWRMDFFHPNFQNDMWRIFGLVFFADVQALGQRLDQGRLFTGCAILHQREEGKKHVVISGDGHLV